MKFITIPLMLFGCVALLAAQAAKNTGRDPYEPLKLYEGGWQLKMTAPEAKLDRLVNHCARTGMFFSCEQELNGKTAALVIFLPVGNAGSDGLEYRTLVAQPDASKPDDWGHLVIEGDTWIYSWTRKEGEKVVQMHNVNHFKDQDHIHFELQNMEEGAGWKTQMSGDEERVK